MKFSRAKKYCLLIKKQKKLNLLIHCFGKASEKTIEDKRKKQADALKSLEFSKKQLPSIKDFISKETKS